MTTLKKIQKNGRRPKKNKKIKTTKKNKEWKTTYKKMEDEPINQNQPNWL